MGSPSIANPFVEEKVGLLNWEHITQEVDSTTAANTIADVLVTMDSFMPEVDSTDPEVITTALHRLDIDGRPASRFLAAIADAVGAFINTDEHQPEHLNFLIPIIHKRTGREPLKPSTQNYLQWAMEEAFKR